jgi:hypothetical protein
MEAAGRGRREEEENTFARAVQLAYVARVVLSVETTKMI